MLTFTIVPYGRDVTHVYRLPLRMAATNGTSWPSVLLGDMLLEHHPISGESNAEKIGRNYSLLLLIEVWNVNLYNSTIWTGYYSPLQTLSAHGCG